MPLSILERIEQIENNMFPVLEAINTKLSSEVQDKISGTLILNKNTINLVAINVENMNISDFIDAIGSENVEIANAYNNGSWKNFIVGFTNVGSSNDFSLKRIDGETEEIQPFFIKIKDIPEDITYEWGA